MKFRNSSGRNCYGSALCDVYDTDNSPERAMTCDVAVNKGLQRNQGTIPPEVEVRMIIMAIVYKSPVYIDF